MYTDADIWQAVVLMEKCLGDDAATGSAMRA